MCPRSSFASGWRLPCAINNRAVCIACSVFHVPLGGTCPQPYARQGCNRSPVLSPGRPMTGQRLGPWTLDAEIGTGGMGSVWRAHANPPPEGCPSVAAVKVLAPEVAAEPEFRARFQREAEVLARLNHAGIVRYYGSG